MFFHLLIRYMAERVRTRTMGRGSAIRKNTAVFYQWRRRPISAGQHMADRYRELIPA